MASASQNDEPEASKVNTDPSPDLLKALSETFSKHGPSDLTIRTSDEREFHVHKKVVCQNCDFFKKAVNGPFKEASSGVINLSNDPPAAVTALLQYLYTYEYHYYPVENGPYPMEYLFHMDVYIIGMVYDVTNVRSRASDKVRSSLKKLETSGLSEIPKVVSILYQSTLETRYDPLRDWLFRYSADHFEALLRDTQFLEVMMSFPDFRMSVLKITEERSKDIHEHILALQSEADDPSLDLPSENINWADCPHCEERLHAERLWEMHTIYCSGCKRVFSSQDFIYNSDWAKRELEEIANEMEWEIALEQGYSSIHDLPDD